MRESWRRPPGNYQSNEIPAARTGIFNDLLITLELLPKSNEMPQGSPGPTYVPKFGEGN
jgi:hypothetical protein